MPIRSLSLRICALGVAFLAFVACLTPLTSVLAGKASSVTYGLSRHKTATSANHTLTFTTPTGVDGPTDTIVISGFDVFDITSIGVGDIDLSHGPTTGSETSESLAASAAAGIWGVSIGATGFTFTPPTNAVAGEISANDIILIKIGTNASGGANQITNPATAQVTKISLSGEFGDRFLVGVPIVTGDSVAVTATIAASGSGSGSGGGGAPVAPGDTTAPSINNIKVSQITETGAVITWTTNEVADSRVQYGVSDAYGDTVSSNQLVTSHAQTLANLTKGTTYHYRVFSKDSANNQTSSTDLTFKTLGDITPPIISNIGVTNITATSARITWRTDENSDSRVDYGIDNFNLNASFVTSTKIHSILLPGLQAAASYNFFVTSKDGSGNLATSSVATFTSAPDSTPPANVTLTATSGDGIVHLSWVPPPDADYAGVRIVRRTNQFPASPNDGVLVYQGAATSTDDKGVTNGTTYYYGAFAFDNRPNYASGALAQAKPESEEPESLPEPPLEPEPQPQPQPQPGPQPKPGPAPGPISQDGGGIFLPGIVTSTPITPASTSTVYSIKGFFFAAGGALQLVPDVNGQIGALTGTVVMVTLPIVDKAVAPQRAVVAVGGSLYNLGLDYDGKAYSGTFVVPSPTGSYPVTITGYFQDSGVAVQNNTLLSQGGGKVVKEGLIKQTDEIVDDASVTLYTEREGAWEKWNAGVYGQSNPQKTDSRGLFAFIVPPGRYYAEVEKPDYKKTVTAPRYILGQVFGERVGLIEAPISRQKLQDKISVATTTSGKVEVIAKEIAKDVLKQAQYGATVVRTVLQSPEAKVVQQATSPALVGVAVVNLASTLPVFNFFAYLQFFFTQPLLLLGRRKRLKWGVVYNSLTKEPIELAIVRLLDMTTGLVVQTKVTDRAGRYSFIAKPGVYRIEVVKPGYSYPTQYLKDKQTDVSYTNLYQNTAIELSEGGIVAKNIAIDPVESTETPQRILWRKTLRSFQGALSMVGVILGIVGFTVTPGFITAGLAVFQVVAYVGFKRMAHARMPRPWGRILEALNGQPLSRVVVRIFDRQFNKLLETQITEPDGRYGFFVRQNVYYVTAEKQGYAKTTTAELDLRQSEQGLVDLDIKLQKIAKLEQDPKSQ